MKPIHGNINTLSEAESLQLLARNTFAHLACHIHDQIYVLPITYAFEDGYFYSHSKPGRKIEMMRKNSSICIQVEEVQDFFHWKSVIAWGKFEELKEDRASSAMRLLIRKVVGKGDAISPLELDLTAQLESTIIYQMKVDSISGRFESK